MPVSPVHRRSRETRHVLSRRFFAFVFSALIPLTLTACADSIGTEQLTESTATTTAQASSGGANGQPVTPQARAKRSESTSSDSGSANSASQESIQPTASASEPAPETTELATATEQPTTVAKPVLQPTDSSNSANNSAINNIETMVEDMARLNDLPLTGVNPKYGFARGPGFVVMGNDPRGINTPPWHQSQYPHLINGNYWNYILPWFVHFEGDGNSASNTAIHMRHLRLWVKSRSTGRWTQVNNGDALGGTQCPHGSNYFHCSRAGQIRRNADQSQTAQPEPSFNLHGWWGGRQLITGSDVAAVVVTLQARLTLANAGGIDDRARARYLIQVGADYYYTDGSAPTVLPGVGVSRAKLLNSQWQSFSMTTFNDVGNQEPGGGISTKQLRDDPPPLD